MLCVLIILGICKLELPKYNFNILHLGWTSLFPPQAAFGHGTPQLKLIEVSFSKGSRQFSVNSVWFAPVKIYSASKDLGQSSH